MSELLKDEYWLLGWLSAEDSSALGECHGKALDSLVSKGLAQVGPPPPGKDPLYGRVSLTEAGHRAAAEARDRTFPVLNSHPKASLPWAFAETFRAQAEINHGQTLEQLAGRGGLDWNEIRWAMLSQRWTSHQALPPDEALAAVRARLVAWESARATRRGGLAV